MKQNIGNKTSSFGWMIGGASLGALAMLLSEPDRGKRRRELAADKVRNVVDKTGMAVSVASRDLGNRMQGVRAHVMHMLTRNNIVVEDDVLTARVRQRMGRAVSDPRKINVVARDGLVTLSGPVLAEEKDLLLATVRRVHGVGYVDDRTHICGGTEDKMNVQAPEAPGEPGAQTSWTPSVRAAALVGGGALGTYGLARRTPASLVLATIGVALAARSVANMPLARAEDAEPGGDDHQADKASRIAVPAETSTAEPQAESFPP